MEVSPMWHSRGACGVPWARRVWLAGAYMGMPWTDGVAEGGEGAWTYGSHMRTYSGSCHCGRVRFEIDAELDHVRVCDCSFCAKRGALVHRVPPERFRMLSEWSELSLYEWNTKTATLFLQDVRRLPLPSPAHSTGAMGDQRPLP